MGILDTNGLKKLWEHILQALEIKVDKELNKTLTTNDYTDEEKDKVDYAYRAGKGYSRKHSFSFVFSRLNLY